MPRLDYRERRAPSALAPWVECSWELRLDRGQPPHAHRVLPDGCIDLVWTIDAGLTLVGPNPTAFMAELPPGTSAVGVRMHPGGAPSLLGVSAPALLDARVMASELWGARGERLEEEVARAVTPEQQAMVLLRWLALQARSARPPDPVVRALTARLLDAPEALTAIARELGYGERQLRRRVVAEVGYGPKYLARECCACGERSRRPAGASA